MRFEPQIRPTKFSINFLFFTARVERKVHLYVKLFDFFPRWILIRLTWNLSRFVPNSVQILTWNFRKKLFRDNFSEIFWKTQAILQQNFWNFVLLSAILFRVKNCVEKFKLVLSCALCTLRRRHVHKQIIKRRYREEKPEHFFFLKTSFFHSRSGSYYALFLGYFGLKILPDIHHCVYWVLAEIWAPDSSHEIFNNFFIHHCQGWKEGSFVCETVWFFS